MKRRWIIRSLAGVVVLGVVVLLGIAWVLSTSTGARIVLDRVATMLGQGTKVTGVEGSLWGTLRIKSIEVARPDLVIHIRDVILERETDAPWLGRVVFRRVEAAFIEVRTASAGGSRESRVSRAAKPEPRISRMTRTLK